MKRLTANKELEKLAKHYVWWESPSWAMDHPEILLANIMNLGNWEAFCTLRQLFNNKTLNEVLKNAPPGSFSNRSWDYWHLALGHEHIPPLPKRKFK